ncbi:MAG TPA: sigma-70 family RNA polymerase sigma factor [Povalibacter sp.]|nr:sigma-70 family RNA polymerase sigma factor [Povalibacter sp.]
MSYPSDRSIDTNVPEAADDRRRFEALCLPYQADLYRFVYWLCRNRSLTEDVMQETLLRAWRSIGSLGDEKAARSWLLTIARRELARTFERKRLDTVDLEGVAEAGDASLTVSETPEVDEMRAAIQRLDATYREPLVLQVLFGYSTEEIATQLEISVPAVLTRLYRARHLLRRQLLGEQGDGGADELS